MITEILETLFLILVTLMIAYLIRHYIFTLIVLKNPQKRGKAVTAGTAAYQPTVSILIPALNEEKVIGRILQRMTELTYAKDKMEIIVIDDASTDDTGKIAEQYSKAYSYIKVIHRSEKEGGRGKASALNAGLKHAKGEIILCFDVDYYPQRDILEKLTKEFADPKVGAVQGRVTVLNEPQNIVTRLVTLERIGGYRVDQQARDNLGLITQLGGTVQNLSALKSCFSFMFQISNMLSYGWFPYLKLKSEAAVDDSRHVGAWPFLGIPISNGARRQRAISLRMLWRNISPYVTSSNS